MKIRIQGNTIRLRLKKSEIAIFSQKGEISETIVFGENRLIYSLKMIKSKKISTTFTNNTIIVNIPIKLAKTWIESKLVEMSCNNVTPNILIEKDFKCTSNTCKDTKEQQEDYFPNPKKSC